MSNAVAVALITGSDPASHHQITMARPDAYHYPGFVRLAETQAVHSTVVSARRKHKAAMINFSLGSQRGVTDYAHQPPDGLRKTSERPVRFVP